MERAKIQVLSYNTEVIDSAINKILRTVESLKVGVSKKPRWERFNPSREQIELYGTDMRRIKMKTMVVEGERDDIKNILRIPMKKEMDMKGGIYMRMIPTK